MRAAALALATLILACSPPSTRPTATISTTATTSSSVASSATGGAYTAFRLSPDGWGPVHVGSTIAEARNALNAQLDASEVSGSDSCTEYSVHGFDGVAIMVIDGRVTRISTGAEGVTTPEGIEVGSTDAQVRAIYPRAQAQSAPYDDPPAHDLVVWRHPHMDGLRFEIDARGRVVRIHGGNDSILYVEGCL